MMKKTDRLWIGMATGILAPALAFVLFVLIWQPHLSVMENFARVNAKNKLSHVISLCAIINLLFFFLFLKFNMERAARGVIGATILYGFVILYLKLT